MEQKFYAFYCDAEWKDFLVLIRSGSLHMFFRPWNKYAGSKVKLTIQQIENYIKEHYHPRENIQIVPETELDIFLAEWKLKTI